MTTVAVFKICGHYNCTCFWTPAQMHWLQTCQFVHAQLFLCMSLLPSHIHFSLCYAAAYTWPLLLTPTGGQLQNEAIPKVNTFNLFMNLNSASVATCDLLARWTAASDWNIWSYPSTVYNTTIVSCLRPAYFTDMMATSKWYEKQKFKQNKANKYCNLNQNCSKKQIV